MLFDSFRILPADFESIVLWQQTLAPNECPVCGNTERVNYGGGGFKGGLAAGGGGSKQNLSGGVINTYSGNYNYQTGDMTVPAVGRPLSLERSYNSLPVTGTVVYTYPLGYGWTHNYDIKLTFPGNPGGEANTIILKAPHGSRMRFWDYGDGTYAPFVGVWANLTRTGTSPTYTYTVTAANQESFVFDTLGRLIQQRDAQGNLTTLAYNASQRLYRVTDAASGRYLGLSYNSAGRLATLFDHTNRQVTYSYSSNGDLTRVVDTRGMTWTYAYSGSSHLLHTITDPTGKIVEKTFYNPANGSTLAQAYRQENGLGQPTVQVAYNGATRQVTELGRVMTDTYNSQGLLVSQTNAANQSYGYTLDNNLNRSQVLDALNRSTSYARTALGYTTAMTDALNGVTRFGYSADGRNNLTSITDARNNTIAYTYDISNNLKTVTTVSGTIVYTYNSRSQVISTTNELGKLTTYTYDPTSGNLTRMTDALSNQTNFTYDTIGRVTRMTNGRGYVTRFQYDPTDNISAITENYLTTTCPANECNLITAYVYDNAGRLTRLTDPNNVQTRYEYDNAGRLSRVIRSYVNGVHEAGEAPDKDVITRYEYDTATSRLLYVYDPLDRRIRYEYDALGRVQRVIQNYQDGSYSSANPDQDIVTTYGYDAVGNLTGVTNNAGEAITYGYDVLNRLNQVQSPLSTVEYRYDEVGNLSKLLTPSSKYGQSQIETRYGYDALNRLVSVIENYRDGAFSASVTDEDVTTRYSYDPVGNLTQIQNPKSKIQNFQYDALNRLTQITDPLIHTTHYGYDAVDNTTVMTDAKNQVTTFSYDPVNRLDTINYPSGTPDVAFNYDKADNVTSMVETGGTGTTSYSYDNLYRLTGSTNGAGQAVGYAYNLAGQRANLTYPDNKVITYTYDAVNRLKTVTDWRSGRYTYTYSTAGRLDALNLPNSITASYGYDSAGRLTGLTYISPTGTLANYQYQLDAAGNRRVVTETVVSPGGLGGLSLNSGGETAPPASDTDMDSQKPASYVYLPLLFKRNEASAPASSSSILISKSLTSTLYLPLISKGNGSIMAADTFEDVIPYGYDGLYRLVDSGSQNHFGKIYEYDAAGNRTLENYVNTILDYEYDDANRLITRFESGFGFSYNWDNNGNLLTAALGGGVMTNTWDAADRLTSSTFDADLYPSNVISFTYDGLGNRVSQIANSATTNLALDVAAGLPEVIYTSQGVKYLHLPGIMMAQNGTTPPQYLLPDGLGSVRQTISGTAITGFFEYDPYGNFNDGFSTPTPYGFTGEWLEPNQGLLYLRARWYNPYDGIFLSRDPYPGDLRRPQSLNGFSYVEGNPVNRTDPSGMMGCDGGGNMAVMQYDNCLTGGHGGINLGQPMGGGVVPIVTAITVAAALWQVGQWVYNNLPGFDLQPPQGWNDLTTPGVIQPCWQFPGTNITPVPFWLPGYGQGNRPYLGLGPIRTPLLPPGYFPTTLNVTPTTHANEFEPVKGTKAQRHKITGEIWFPDLFHKNHWEVYKNKKDFEKGKRDRAVWNDGRLKEKF